MRAKIIAILVCVAITFGVTCVAISVLTSSHSSNPPSASPPHIEARGTVAWVYDGDTITIDLTWVDQPREGITVGKRESIRFSGGIDAPELEDTGGYEAKNHVSELCTSGIEVSLDLDDESYMNSGTPYRDHYGRIVAVIYVNENGRWINVNADVLRWGQQTYPNHDWLKYAWMHTEFDYHEWLRSDYPYLR